MSLLWSGVSETPSLAWHVVIYNDGEYILVIKCIGYRTSRTMELIRTGSPPILTLHCIWKIEILTLELTYETSSSGGDHHTAQCAIRCHSYGTLTMTSGRPTGRSCTSHHLDLHRDSYIAYVHTVEFGHAQNYSRRPRRLGFSARPRPAHMPGVSPPR